MRYILVHGTFDSAESDRGDSWWQQGSVFRQKLEDQADAEGAAVDAFRWSGENRHQARVKAGRELARMVRSVVRDDREVRIIAHSHGGNVVNYALNHIPQRLLNRIRVTTVGTPFISTRRHFLYSYNFGDFAGAVGVLLAGFFAFESVPNFVAPDAVSATEDQIELVAAIAFMFFLLRGPFMLSYRFLRRKWAKRPTLRVIAHADDEAILLLERLGGMQLSPLSFEEMRATISRLAIPVGSLTWMGAAAAVLLVPQQFSWLPNGEGLTIASTQLWLNAIAFATVALFLAGTIVAALGWIFAWPLTKLVNAIVDGALKSGAFGTLGGRSVERVAATPTELHEVISLPPGLTDQMREETSNNLGARAGEVKRKLTRSLDLDRDGLALLFETFEWDELIHTYYFRSPAMQKVILETVAAPVREPEMHR
jgi:hypothetical protein